MFNVYINGIDPSQTGNLAALKQVALDKLGLTEWQFVQISHKKPEKICFRESLSKQGATTLCNKLTQMGFLCSSVATNEYSLDGLSLVPMEAPEEESFICPACQQKKPLGGKPEPKLCPFCNVHVEQYRQKLQEEEEYEQIRKNLLVRAQYQNKIQEDEQNKLDRIKRRAKLEADAAKELGINNRPYWLSLFYKSQTGQPNYLGLVGLLTAVGILAGSGYATYHYYADNYLNIPNHVMPGENGTTMPDTDPTIKVADNEMPDMEAFTNTSKTPSQIALTKNYNNIAKLTTAKQQFSGNNQLTGENQVFINSIFNELQTDDAEWDLFLSKTIQSFIKEGKFKSAYNLSQAQLNLFDHIESTDHLVQAFTQLGLDKLVEISIHNLSTRIENQPEYIKPIALTQLAGKLEKWNKPNHHLYTQADQLSLTLQNPLLKSQALLKMAVYLKQANLPDADKTLALAEQTINQLEAVANFNASIDLIRVYAKMGYHKQAEATVLEISKKLQQLPVNNQNTAKATLLAVAYLLDNKNLAEQYSSTLNSAAYRSKASYDAMLWLLQDGHSSEVYKRRANITESDFSAVARALSAYLEPEIDLSQSLLDTAKQQLQSITDARNKAVASSKVARYLARLGHNNEAQLLFSQAVDLVTSNKESNQQDTLLAILAVDQARSFFISNAEKTAKQITHKPLQEMVMAMVENAETAKETMH